MDLWAASLHIYNDSPPFTSADDMLSVIDSTDIGGVPWDCFQVGYTGTIDGNSPSWVHDKYEVWFRDPRQVIHEMLANPEFAAGFSYAPVRDFVNGIERQYSDYMTGNAAWRHAVRVLIFGICV